MNIHTIADIALYSANAISVVSIIRASKQKARDDKLIQDLREGLSAAHRTANDWWAKWKEAHDGSKKLYAEASKLYNYTYNLQEAKRKQDDARRANLAKANSKRWLNGDVSSIRQYYAENPEDRKNNAYTFPPHINGNIWRPR
jgi:hypothetical protein